MVSDNMRFSPLLGLWFEIPKEELFRQGFLPDGFGSPVRHYPYDWKWLLAQESYYCKLCDKTHRGGTNIARKHLMWKEEKRE